MPHIRNVCIFGPISSCSAGRKYLHTERKPFEPLRVLFCGSDDFSITSLKAIHDEHLKDADTIASLDVVCRPGKKVGRGMKIIRETPIAHVAEKLGLPLHKIDTFTNWELPRNEALSINLIIAVSFGRLVPPRILGNAKYGGLNVHPSILPEFRGAAPLHHTLLAGHERTGVTVQTLHPKHFDQGVILAQTPYPGFEHKSETVSKLCELTAIKGADMLLQCIREGRFVPPLEPQGYSTATMDSRAFRLAPKITPNDRQVKWESWTAGEILRRHRVIGPLWNNIVLNDDRKTVIKRVIWSSGFVESFERPNIDIAPGQPYTEGPDRTSAYVRTVDDKLLRVDQCTFDGGQLNDPKRGSKHAGVFSGQSLQGLDYKNSGVIKYGLLIGSLV